MDQKHFISIIIVSYNLGEMTRECVESIQANVTLPFEIIIVDNYSDERTLHVLEKLDDVRLIKNNKNMGFPRACNQGANIAQGDILWLLNNDTIVPSYSLERMTEVLLSDTSVGMVGPVTNNIRGRQQIPVDYTEGIYKFAEKQRRDYGGQTWRVLNMVGFSMLLRRSTFQEVGGLDERMEVGTFEDDELCLKLAEKGYKLLITRDAFIHHHGNASFKAAGGYPSTGENNQAIASSIAGLTVPVELVLNQELLPMISEDTKHLLHIECGAGALGFWALENGICAQALESNPQKARFARNAYTQLDMYTKGKDFNFMGTDFDSVVLEKQGNEQETLSVLRSVSMSLSPGCQVLFQIPLIVDMQRNQFSTYLENWSDRGCCPVYGTFDMPLFLTEMDKMGFVLSQYKLEKRKNGFFNSCAYSRYLKDRKKEGALSFFYGVIGEFKYIGHVKNNIKINKL